jgi:hypothetical protein
MATGRRIWPDVLLPRPVLAYGTFVADGFEIALLPAEFSGVP